MADDPESYTPEQVAQFAGTWTTRDRTGTTGRDIAKALAGDEATQDADTGGGSGRRSGSGRSRDDKGGRRTGWSGQIR